MAKLLSDEEVLRDFHARQRKPPVVVDDESTLEPLADAEIKREFVIGGVLWTCFAQDGRELELLFDATELSGDFRGIKDMDQRERDELQLEMDKTILALRKKLGKPVAVLAAGPVPPVWDDL